MPGLRKNNQHRNGSLDPPTGIIASVWLDNQPKVEGTTMVARVEKWSTTGGQIFDNREDAERAEMSEDVRAFMESLWRRSDTKVSKHQFTAIADLITDHIDEFRAVITGIAVEEQQQQPDLPFHDSDDGICSICDGGPGNNSTCSCP